MSDKKDMVLKPKKKKIIKKKHKKPQVKEKVKRGGFLPFMKRKESDSEISQKEFVFESGGQDVTVTVYRKRMV
jgi:predicted RNA-binding protein